MRQALPGALRTSFFTVRYKKNDFVCQEDFDHKIWGVVPMTAPGDGFICGTMAGGLVTGLIVP